MISANWKANGDIESNKAWCNQLIARMSDRDLNSIGIAPSYLHFNQIKNAFKNNDIEIGFQDIDIEAGLELAQFHHQWRLITTVLFV